MRDHPWKYFVLVLPVTKGEVQKCRTLNSKHRYTTRHGFRANSFYTNCTTRYKSMILIISKSVENTMPLGVLGSSVIDNYD